MYMAWRTCFSYHWLFVCCHISSYCSFVWHSKCTVTCVAGSAFDAVSRRASFCSVAFACLICAGSIWKKYYRNECSDRTLWMVLNGKNRAHTGKNSKRKWICHGITVHGRRFFSCALLASCSKFSSIHFIYDYYECTNSNSRRINTQLSGAWPSNRDNLVGQYARTCPECLRYARMVDDFDSRPFFNTPFFMPHRDRKLVPRAHES